MNTGPAQLTCEIDLQPGETLRLPSSLVDRVGPGHWLLTITPLAPATTLPPMRAHAAFLNSYAPEDEGLYDDYPAR
jgi:hypothetical protein